ncbi:hypothetical protein HDV05_008381 [Chytridiales sp. JEL 0842]|nr:hypothetical protein HDV05_008381 [Chytridiales sp. JEL 0842]
MTPTLQQLRYHLRPIMRFDSFFGDHEMAHSTSQYDRVALNSRTRYFENVKNAVRLRGTILPKIVPLLFLIVAEATVVSFLTIVMEFPLHMDDKMITMMGSAIAMLLAFRTNRSFERYNLGAQLWTSLAAQIRHLSRIIWNGVHNASPDEMHEKLQVMKLLLASAVATKYALRGHEPHHYSELTRLLPSGYLQKSYRGSQVDLYCTAEDVSSKPSSSVPSYLTQRSSPYVYPQSQRNSISGRGGQQQQQQNFSGLPSLPPKARFNPQNVINAPLDIIHRISQYIRRQRQSGNLDAEDNAAAMRSISTAIDSVTRFEQLLYIDARKSYDVHIKQILLLYFVALPFQLVKNLGWNSIFVALVTGIAFFGADAIAGEISEPFGTDQNDLPMDYFCNKLKEDIEYIMERPLDMMDRDVSGSKEDLSSYYESVMREQEGGRRKAA